MGFLKEKLSKKYDITKGVRIMVQERASTYKLHAPLKNRFYVTDHTLVLEKKECDHSIFLGEIKSVKNNKKFQNRIVINFKDGSVLKFFVVTDLGLLFKPLIHNIIIDVINEKIEDNKKTNNVPFKYKSDNSFKHYEKSNNLTNDSFNSISQPNDETLIRNSSEYRQWRQKNIG